MIAAAPNTGVFNGTVPDADTDALFRYVLRLGDLCLVLGQRLGEWVGHSPALEEDLGVANIALDLIGQARLFLTYAGEIEGRGRDEDKLAYLREQGAYFNAILVEQPNGDFGQTIVRQVLIDAFQLELYERMAASSDARLAAIAAKSVKEVRYHLRYSSGWLVRLGDGTAESHARVQTALDLLWPYTVELFAADELDQRMAESGIGPQLSDVYAAWSARIDAVLSEATLQRPADRPHAWHGKRGQHSEHLGYILAEMQYLQRTYPDAPVVSAVQTDLEERMAPAPGVAARIAAAWEILATVEDPEIPALSIVDLGLIRFVRPTLNGQIEVGLSPTYVGCPATEVIRRSVHDALGKTAVGEFEVTNVLSPAWSSDWITPEGRRKLHNYGIVPPDRGVANMRDVLRAGRPVACPRCNSVDTETLSEFGSTPCKALHRCRACLEPFEYFKCI